MSTNNTFFGKRTQAGRLPSGIPKSTFDRAYIMATREVNIERTGLKCTQHLAILDLQPVELFVLPMESLVLLNQTVSDYECWELLKWQ